MGRPFIHINFAAEDASEAAPLSHVGNISCCADWRRVHQLRERYDAVAVGGRTWNLDRPRLTIRSERLGREPRRQPRRVIFAGSHPCEVPPGAPAFVVRSRGGERGEAVALAMTSHDLLGPLASLHAQGIESMLVEGGPTLLRSFLRQGLADAMTVFVRAGTAEAADRGVRDSLGALPGDFRVSAFGEGFLLEAGRIEAMVA